MRESGNWSVMGVLGGIQFRTVNTPVVATAVPSWLNNVAPDVPVQLRPDTEPGLLVGGSFLRASAYSCCSGTGHGPSATWP